MQASLACVSLGTAWFVHGRVQRICVCVNHRVLQSTVMLHSELLAEPRSRFANKITKRSGEAGLVQPACDRQLQNNSVNPERRSQLLEAETGRHSLHSGDLSPLHLLPKFLEQCAPWGCYVLLRECADFESVDLSVWLLAGNSKSHTE
ncbi:hypothetical protein NDU88_001406 [Pleurodeles waltl]|uniref:Secreted protein n=1 Tax=Pleurodeles waltl TaxID=8319 RepID=A0AAV7P3P8_PLEWA|nr:hypothetical protein NDU88_001406 [Pleurodeles waltl]